MTTMKKVPLNQIFDFPAIKGLTADFIMRNSGNIPVYGGKMTETPIGYISHGLPDVKYFSDCLAWNREGSVGYVFHHKGVFSTNDHHRPMIIKEKYISTINLDYIQIVLEKHLLSQGFEWSKTASKDKVSRMSIDIPVCNGQFDIDAQNSIVEVFHKYKHIKHTLNGFNVKLSSSTVLVENPYTSKKIYLSDDIFELSIGKRVLKKHLLKEGVAVYSANPSKIFGYIDSSNIDSFDSDSILWGIDGNFEFGFMPKNRVFATTDHCGRIQIKDKMLLSEYVYYQLRENASLYGFDRVYRASLNNIGIVSISVPVDENGDFDLLAQKDLILKYKNIDTIKKNMLDMLSYLINSTLEL